MTGRAAFFVVARDLFGREAPAIYWDELPREPIRRLTYVARLDTFPNGPQLLAASTPPESESQKHIVSTPPASETVERRAIRG